MTAFLICLFVLGLIVATERLAQKQASVLISVPINDQNSSTYQNSWGRRR